MRIISCMLLAMGWLAAFAQKNISSTNEFTIEGRIKKQFRFTLAELDTFATRNLPDVVISNHLGEKKGTLARAKGIPFKSILSKLELDAESPKAMSEFYFVFVASDGYRIVFSWNEIFNSETGNNIYLVTEKDGKKLKEMDDRLLTICTTDFTTGRRYLKGLTKILVGRFE